MIVEPLLDHAWYRANLAHTYPRLVVPATALPGAWRPALEAANARPPCDALPEAPEALTCRAQP